MSNVHADITSAPTSVSVPFGAPTPSVASYLFNLTNPDGSVTPVTLAAGATSTDVTVTQVGNYTATVQAVDQNGSLIGNAVTSNTLAVTGPTVVTLSVPATLTLSQTA